MNGNLFIGALSTLSERIIDGGVIFVQGLLTVFAVLAILWGALALFKVFFYDIPEKKKNKSEEKSEPAAPIESFDTSVSTSAPVEDEGAIVAAITAALSEYFAQSGEYTGGFRVVSFRKSHSSSAWNRK